MGAMCEPCGKQRLHPREAERIAKKMRRRGERVTAYPCPHSRGFHVGHAESSQGERRNRERRPRRNSRAA